MNIKFVSPEFLRILPTIMDVLYADNNFLMNSDTIRNMDEDMFDNFVLYCAGDIMDLGMECNYKVIEYVVKMNLDRHAAWNNQCVTPMRDIVTTVCDNETGEILYESRIEQTDDEGRFLRRLKYVMREVRNAPKGKLEVKFD